MIKRFIGRVSLLMAMLLFCASCAFAASYPCGGYATKNAVNVRKKASQSSDPVGKLKLNETVTVLGEAQNGKTLWYKIEFAKGIQGYVRGDLIALQAAREETTMPESAPAPASAPAAAANPPAAVAHSSSQASSDHDPFYLLRGLGLSANDWYAAEDYRYIFATAIMVGTFVHQEAGVTNIFEESLSRDSVYMIKKDHGVGLICFGNDAVVFASWLTTSETGNHTVIQDLGGVPASQFDMVMQILSTTDIMDEYQRLDSYRILQMVEEQI